MKGIDISHHQGNIDFDAVKNDGYEIVYIKATEGKTYNDPKMTANYNGAIKAGLKISFYHFLRANDPVDEAKHFLDAVNGLDADCKYCIDVETTENQSKDQISERVRKFADYLIAQGKEVCIYTGDNFYANNLNDTVKDLPLWVAHYGVDKPDTEKYIGFQYTSKGKVSGISGNVDLDEFSDDIMISGKQKVSEKEPVKTAYDFKSLQKTIGVKEDNIPGPITLSHCPLLKTGSRGDAAKWAQNRLNYLGYDCGTVDGIFGSNTLAGVLAFQKAKGLKDDGIIGPKTWTKLLGL